VTVCGFARTRDGAFAWADSEAYGGDRRPLADPKKKLSVSAGGLVGMTTGYLTLCENFCSLVEDFGRASFASALERLPTMLRIARAGKRAELRALDMEYKFKTTYALCTSAGGGFRGAVFFEGRDYEPVECDAWSSPDVDLAVNSANDVLDLAQKQIRFIQAKWPTATGRKLAIAKLGADSVKTVSVPLLIGEERAPRAPPAASAGDSAAHMVAAVRAADAERLRRYWG
jgi:hypothetical protein